MLQFKKVELEDIEIFKKYMQREDELSCENAFVNLLVWQCAYNNMWAEYEGQLFIKSGSGEKQSFRLPIGGNLQRGIEIIEEYCGKKPFIWAQNGKNFKNFRETFSESFEFIENRNAFDYIYLRDALADLSGKKYHSKRNHISAFSKKHNWRYEKITDSNIGEIKSCAESWYRENKERLKDSMLCEQKGIQIMLDNFDYLELKGAAIYVDEKAVAFTIGSAINSQCFDIHIEKALADFGEAYTLINREFAKNELGDFKYINREDDMGLEGLRKAKLSYKPEILLEKFRCLPR